MTGTQLAVTDGARGVMCIDLSKVNYGLAKSAIDKHINAVGGSSSKKAFPGDGITFKQGEWYRGFGDKKRSVKMGTTFVFNVPNMMTGYQKFEENDNGKKFPKFSTMRFPAAGDEPIARDTLGDDDQDDWEQDDKGKPQDPWKSIVVFPVRSDEEAEVHHIALDGISKVIAGFNLFRDVLEDMKLHEGQLPLVKLGSKKTSRDIVAGKDKKGRDKKEKQTWFVPTFEVVGWVDAIDADNPAKGGVKVTADSEAADLGKVEAKARVSTKANGKANGKALTKATTGKVAAKPTKTSRKAIEVDDDDTL